eukprot:gene31582-38170_t
MAMNKFTFLIVIFVFLHRTYAFRPVTLHGLRADIKLRTNGDGGLSSEAALSLLKELVVSQSDVKKGLTELKSEMTEFKKEMKSEMTEFKKEMKSEMTEFKWEMKSEMTEFKKEMKSEMTEFKREMKSEVTSISSTLNDFRGETNERLLRSAMKETYGPTFASSFNVQGLTGLAQLVSARKRNFFTLFSDAVEKNLLHQYDLTKEDFFGQGKRAKGAGKSMNLPPSAIARILNLFVKADANGKKSYLRQDNGVGLLLFTAAVGCPMHEMELDCRGRITTLENNHYIVGIGEIKSSRRGLGDAVVKDSKVLAVMDKALKLAVNDQGEVTVSKHLIVAILRAERNFDAQSLPVSPDWKVSVVYFKNFCMGAGFCGAVYLLLARQL